MRKAVSYHSGGQRPHGLVPGSVKLLRHTTDGYVVVCRGPHALQWPYRAACAAPVRCAPITRGARAGRSSRTRSDAAVPALCVAGARQLAVCAVCRSAPCRRTRWPASARAGYCAARAKRQLKYPPYRVIPCPGLVARACIALYLSSGPFRPVGVGCSQASGPTGNDSVILLCPIAPLNDTGREGRTKNPPSRSFKGIRKAIIPIKG